MMDGRLATKDKPEREDEEVDRLHRPSPHVKPPRHDKRREQIQPDADPDLDESDPDLSLNRREVGGSSVAQRVLARLLQAKGAETDKVTVRNTETDKVVQVNPETVQENPGKYEEVKDDGSEAEEPHLTTAIRERLKSDPGFASMAKALSDPKSMGKIDDGKPLPETLAKVFPGLKTFGEARKTVSEASKASPPAKKVPPVKLLDDAKPKPVHPPRPPRPQKPAKPAPPDVPNKDRPDKDAPRDTYDGKPKEEGPKPPSKRYLDDEKLKPPGAPSPGPKPAPSSKDEPAKPPAEPAKQEGQEKPPTQAEPTRQEGQAKPTPKAQTPFDDWVAKGGLSDPGFQEYLDSAPENLRTPGTPVLVWNPQKKTREPFADLPPEQQKAHFEEWSADTKAKQQEAEAKAEEQATLQRDALYTEAFKKNPKVAKLLQALSDPASEPSKRLAELGKKKGVGALVPEKVFPELAGLPTLEVTNDLDRLASFAKRTRKDWAPDPYEGKSDLKEFVDGVAKEEETYFLEYALTPKNKPRIKVPKGKTLKGYVASLPVADQEKLFNDFAKHLDQKNLSTDVQKLSAGSPELAKTLQAMFDPRSPLSKKAAENTQLPASELHPKLAHFKNVTVGELLKASKPLLVPPKLPTRENFTYRQQLDALNLLDRTFPEKTAKRLYELHPTDIASVVAAYKATQSKGATLPEKLLKSGGFQTDINKVRPPLTWEVSGKTVPFSSLDEKAQTDAYLQHRAMVVAASLQAEDTLASTCEKGGVPKEASRLFARVRMDTVPGESPEERTERATVIGRKAHDHAVTTAAPVIENPKEALSIFAHGKLRDEATHKIALQYSKGADYRSFIDRFLSRKAKDPLSEHDTVSGAMFKVKALSEEVDRRSKQYPKEDQGFFRTMKGDLRAFFMERLANLSPKKADLLSVALEDSRSSPWAEGLLPPKPQAKGIKSWLSSHLKLASYAGAVGTQLTERTSNYRGVAPLPRTPYPPWLPVDHVTEGDATRLLADARKRLDLSVPGRVPDSAYREALDLAVYTLDNGAFSRGLHPTVYNALLAKLSGQPVAPTDTLLTVQKKAMLTQKLASDLRALATKVAEEAPQAAFEIVELAEKVAQDQGEQDQAPEQKQAQDQEQGQGQQQKQAYLTLRSLVIKTAHASQDKAPFLPILRHLKAQGLFLSPASQ